MHKQPPDVKHEEKNMTQQSWFYTAMCKKHYRLQMLFLERAE